MSLQTFLFSLSSRELYGIMRRIIAIALARDTYIYSTGDAITNIALRNI